MSIEIMVIMGIDDESDSALRNCWRAAELLLKDYGLEIYVVPVSTWVHDPIMLSEMKLPKVIIQGRLIAEGRAPSIEEIIDAIIALHLFTLTDVTIIPTGSFRQNSVPEASYIRYF